VIAGARIFQVDGVAQEAAADFVTALWDRHPCLSTGPPIPPGLLRCRAIACIGIGANTAISASLTLTARASGLTLEVSRVGL
jgi:hypothetical protein